MKLERSTKDYGGGSGRGTFESDFFRVVLWTLSGEKKTSISAKLSWHCEIDFDGAHDFDSDDACMEQFNCEEILAMIKHQKKVSFKAGEKSKIEEIKNCFKL